MTTTILLALTPAAAGQEPPPIPDPLLPPSGACAHEDNLEAHHRLQRLAMHCLLDEVGGFDERQWLFAEDLDLGWRLRRAGWETRYEPSAVVDHHESAATAAAFGTARTERTQAETYAWLRRTRGAAIARTVAALNVAGAVARRDRRWAAIHARTGLGRHLEQRRAVPDAAGDEGCGADGVRRDSHC